MTRWKVELYNPHLQDWRTKKVTGSDQATAKRRALEGEAEGWEVDEIDPLCDFCEPCPEPSNEGTSRVVVIDPTDVEGEPEGAEAPTRIAWVCDKQHAIVQGLDTA